MSDYSDQLQLYLNSLTNWAPPKIDQVDQATIDARRLRESMRNFETEADLVIMAAHSICTRFGIGAPQIAASDRPRAINAAPYQGQETDWREDSVPLDYALLENNWPRYLRRA